MKCKECDMYKRMIRKIFDATGYMDLYHGNYSIMTDVIIQGIRKDHKALELYREAGAEAVKALDIVIKPGSCQGFFK